MKHASVKTQAGELDLCRVGRVFKCARENLRYSYRDLAQKTGISHAQLMRMESGAFEFSTARFYKVCAALGVPAGDLIEHASVRTFNPKSRITFEPELEQALPSIGRSGKAKFEKLVLDAFNIAARIITSPNPYQSVLYVSKYLNHRMDEHCHDLAISVSQCSNVERVAMLESLLNNPYAKLKAFRVLLVGDVIAYLRSNDTWSPRVVAPDSINAILEPHLP